MDRGEAITELMPQLAEALKADNPMLSPPTMMEAVNTAQAERVLTAVREALTRELDEIKKSEHWPLVDDADWEAVNQIQLEASGRLDRELYSVMPSVADKARDSFRHSLRRLKSDLTNSSYREQQKHAEVRLRDAMNAAPPNTKALEREIRDATELNISVELRTKAGVRLQEIVAAQELFLGVLARIRTSSDAASSERAHVAMETLIEALELAQRFRFAEDDAKQVSDHLTAMRMAERALDKALQVPGKIEALEKAVSQAYRAFLAPATVERASDVLERVKKADEQLMQALKLPMDEEALATAIESATASKVLDAKIATARNELEKARTRKEAGNKLAVFMDVAELTMSCEELRAAIEVAKASDVSTAELDQAHQKLEQARSAQDACNQALEALRMAISPDTLSVVTQTVIDSIRHAQSCGGDVVDAELITAAQQKLEDATIAQSSLRAARTELEQLTRHRPISMDVEATETALQNMASFDGQDEAISPYRLKLEEAKQMKSQVQIAINALQIVIDDETDVLAVDVEQLQNSIKHALSMGVPAHDLTAANALLWDAQQAQRVCTEDSQALNIKMLVLISHLTDSSDVSLTSYAREALEVIQAASQISFIPHPARRTDSEQTSNMGDQAISVAHHFGADPAAVVCHEQTMLEHLKGLVDKQVTSVEMQRARDIFQVYHALLCLRLQMLARAIHCDTQHICNGTALVPLGPRSPSHAAQQYQSMLILIGNAINLNIAILDRPTASAYEQTFHHLREAQKQFIMPDRRTFTRLSADPQSTSSFEYVGVGVIELLTKLVSAQETIEKFERRMELKRLLTLPTSDVTNKKLCELCQTLVEQLTDENGPLPELTDAIKENLKPYVAMLAQLISDVSDSAAQLSSEVRAHFVELQAKFLLERFDQIISTIKSYGERKVPAAELASSASAWGELYLFAMSTFVDVHFLAAELQEKSQAAKDVDHLTIRLLDRTITSPPSVTIPQGHIGVVSQLFQYLWRVLPAINPSMQGTAVPQPAPSKRVKQMADRIVKEHHPSNALAIYMWLTIADVAIGDQHNIGSSSPKLNMFSEFCNFVSSNRDAYRDYADFIKSAMDLTRELSSTADHKHLIAADAIYRFMSQLTMKASKLVPGAMSAYVEYLGAVRGVIAKFDGSPYASTAKERLKALVFSKMTNFLQGTMKPLDSPDQKVNYEKHAEFHIEAVCAARDYMVTYGGLTVQPGPAGAKSDEWQAQEWIACGNLIDLVSQLTCRVVWIWNPRIQALKLGESRMIRSVRAHRS